MQQSKRSISEESRAPRSAKNVMLKRTNRIAQETESREMSVAKNDFAEAEVTSVFSQSPP